MNIFDLQANFFIRHGHFIVLGIFFIIVVLSVIFHDN